MRKLRFTSEALEQLVDIAVYIAMSTGSRSLAEGFVGQIRQRCIRFASLPGFLGSQRPELRPDLRSFAFKGYVVFFRYPGDDEIEVVASWKGIATSSATSATMMSEIDLSSGLGSTIYE